MPTGAGSVPCRRSSGYAVTASKIVAEQGIGDYDKDARLPSVLSVGTAQTEKEGVAMRKLVFALLVVALVLLLASDAR